ncbi:hypothetical protein BGX38DRAFT_1200574 [Terfezia claveryi]|nr:hypothetical protein BGX38DRAFT_1238015 [Terfezia claveryi]KAF8443384.1 hypothetical protein BGX38DRAFT_1200574 [Terfezia claveryi]
MPTAQTYQSGIQREVGIVVPDDGYLSRVHALCKESNVLLISDRVQTGITRTGKLLCCELWCPSRHRASRKGYL